MIIDFPTCRELGTLSVFTPGDDGVSVKWYESGVLCRHCRWLSYSNVIIYYNLMSVFRNVRRHLDTNTPTEDNCWWLLPDKNLSPPALMMTCWYLISHNDILYLRQDNKNIIILLHLLHISACVGNAKKCSHMPPDGHTDSRWHKGRIHNFLPIWLASNDSLHSIRIDLHWRKMFYEFWGTKIA